MKWDIISGGRWCCQGRIGCLSSSVLLGQRKRLALSCAAEEEAGKNRKAHQTELFVSVEVWWWWRDEGDRQCTNDQAGDDSKWE